MSTEHLFEAALGISESWHVKAVAFYESSSVLTIRVDCQRGARFGHLEAEGLHPVQDSTTRR